MRFPVYDWRLVCASLITLLATGCGPLFLPMSTRLSEEDQQKVDAAWNNMLTPVNRVDHQTMLDTVVAFWLYQLGVDRLHLVSEKYLAGGKVVMEIDCDRANPDADQFTITVLDERGRTLRRERYSRAEVRESSEMFWNATDTGEGPPFAVRGKVSIEVSIQATTQSATQPDGFVTTPAPAPATAPTTRPARKSVIAEVPQTPEQQQRRIERERRMKAVEAATRPATVRGGK